MDIIETALTWVIAVKFIRNAIATLWGGAVIALAFLRRHLSYIQIVLYFVASTYAAFIGLALLNLTEQHTDILEHLQASHSEQAGFTYVGSDIQKQPDGRYSFILRTQYHGAIASDIVSQTLVFEHSLNSMKEPLHRVKEYPANPMGAGIVFQRVQDIAIYPIEGPIFVMHQMQYTDAITNKQGVNAMFLKALVKESKTKYEPHLWHATADEKTRMKRYVKDRGIPIL
ncbi:MAG: hypothetical protein OXF97_07000 [Nitrospira sp.]|nr:hypothetical protein [Nitrospira sp.]